MTPLFDQSIFVRAAIQGVIREGLIAACLTGLMILLFLGNWRSTLIIAISIPLSILVSICVLSALHETINIMTLGGLALAVGILVDDATVEIENINRNLAQGKETVHAILDGAQQIAVPALVSTLCYLHRVRAHVLPHGRRAVPLRAPGRSRRFRHAGLLPALANAGAHAWPCICSRATTARSTPPATTSSPASSAASRRASNACAKRYRDALSFLPRARLDLRIGCFLLFCVLSAPIALLLGRDFFPSVDAGLIRLHMRARAGQRVEETARECRPRSITSSAASFRPEDLGNVLDNIGLFNSTINTTYSNSGVIGESDAEILIGLKPEHANAHALLHRRVARADWPTNFPGTEFFFQPADIVSQILNFGVPAPIDVQLIGTEPCTPTIGSRSRSPAASSRSPARWTFTCSSSFRAHAVPERRPHPRANRRPQPAGRRQ